MLDFKTLKIKSVDVAQGVSPEAPIVAEKTPIISQNTPIVAENLPIFQWIEIRAGRLGGESFLILGDERDRPAAAIAHPGKVVFVWEEEVQQLANLLAIGIDDEGLRFLFDAKKKYGGTIEHVCEGVIDHGDEGDNGRGKQTVSRLSRLLSAAEKDPGHGEQGERDEGGGEPPGEDAEDGAGPVDQSGEGIS